MKNLISSDRFTITKEKNGRYNFAAELSGVPEIKQTGKHYPDGFFIESSRTGLRVEYHIHEVVADKDGEVTHFIYKPILADCKKGEDVSLTRVVLFND